MTDFRALFLLEMMAGDAGMRVVYRAHHHEANGTHAHRVFGPAGQREVVATGLSKARAGWAPHAAEVVLSWPKSPTNPARGGSDVVRAGIHALGPRTLISWIIR
jgi:hypothetical protein